MDWILSVCIVTYLGLLVGWGAPQDKFPTAVMHDWFGSELISSCISYYQNIVLSKYRILQLVSGLCCPYYVDVDHMTSVNKDRPPPVLVTGHN